MIEFFFVILFLNRIAAPSPLIYKVINGGPGQCIALYGETSTVSFNLTSNLEIFAITLEFWFESRCAFLDCALFTLKTYTYDMYVDKKMCLKFL